MGKLYLRLNRQKAEAKTFILAQKKFQFWKTRPNQGAILVRLDVVLAWFLIS